MKPGDVTRAMKKALKDAGIQATVHSFPVPDSTERRFIVASDEDLTRTAQAVVWFDGPFHNDQDGTTTLHRVMLRPSEKLIEKKATELNPDIQAAIKICDHSMPGTMVDIGKTGWKMSLSDLKYYELWVKGNKWGGYSRDFVASIMANLILTGA